MHLLSAPFLTTIFCVFRKSDEALIKYSFDKQYINWYFTVKFQNLPYYKDFVIL